MPVKKLILAGSDAFSGPLAEVIADKKVGRVSIAGSCDTLVSALASDHHDIILLDLRLVPELTTLLAEGAGPETPAVVPAVIVVYSGSFPELSDREQRILPIKGYLREPVDTDLLETMMLRGEKKSAPVPVSTGSSGTPLESLLDSPEQARKVVAVFRQQVPTMLQQMDDLIAEQNWPKLEILVHKMKAGYGYVGAQEIHQVLSTWESEIRGGQDPSRYITRANDLRMRTYTLLGELAIRYAAP